MYRILHVIYIFKQHYKMNDNIQLCLFNNCDDIMDTEIQPQEVHLPAQLQITQHRSERYEENQKEGIQLTSQQPMNICRVPHDYKKLSKSRRLAVSFEKETPSPNLHDIYPCKPQLWGGFDWCQHKLAPPNPPQNSPVKVWKKPLFRSSLNNVAGASTSRFSDNEAVKTEGIRRKFRWSQKTLSKKRFEVDEEK